MGETVKYKEGVFIGYRWFDERGLDVAYPFGYGLALHELPHRDLRIEPRRRRRGRAWRSPTPAAARHRGPAALRRHARPGARRRAAAAAAQGLRARRAGAGRGAPGDASRSTSARSPTGTSGRRLARRARVLPRRRRAALARRRARRARSAAGRVRRGARAPARRARLHAACATSSIRLPRAVRRRARHVRGPPREASCARGRRLRARIDLRGLPRRRVVVRVVGRTRSGRVVRADARLPDVHAGPSEGGPSGLAAPLAAGWLRRLRAPGLGLGVYSRAVRVRRPRSQRRPTAFIDVHECARERRFVHVDGRRNTRPAKAAGIRCAAAKVILPPHQPAVNAPTREPVREGAEARPAQPRAAGILGADDGPPAPRLPPGDPRRLARRLDAAARRRTSRRSRGGRSRRGARVLVAARRLHRARRSRRPSTTRRTRARPSEQRGLDERAAARRAQARAGAAGDAPARCRERVAARRAIEAAIGADARERFDADGAPAACDRAPGVGRDRAPRASSTTASSRSARSSAAAEQEGARGRARASRTAPSLDFDARPLRVLQGQPAPGRAGVPDPRSRRRAAGRPAAAPR